MAAKKYNKKGRNRSFRFAQLEHTLLASADLHHAARLFTASQP